MRWDIQTKKPPLQLSDCTKIDRNDNYDDRGNPKRYFRTGWLRDNRTDFVPDFATYAANLGLEKGDS